MPPGQVARRPDPSAVLAASSLDYHELQLHPDHPTSENFITGISLRGGTEPNKFLTLFISIPYLGIGDKVTGSRGRTLDQYRMREAPTEHSQIVENAILVHQTWLLAFDSGELSTLPYTRLFLGIDIWLETIAIFRSADDQNNNRAPLFASQ